MRSATRPILAFVILWLISFIACKKHDLKDKIPATEQNPVAGMKEWWYAKFRKSDSYQQVDITSPYVFPNSFDETGALHKAPSWKRGIAYTRGKMQVVELPLVYEHPAIVIPGADTMLTDVRHSIASAAVHKLLLFKLPGGRMVERVLTVVPDIQYATANHFDLSSISCARPDSNFSGWFMLRNWQEAPVALWRIERGRRVRKYRIFKTNAAPAKGGLFRSSGGNPCLEPGDTHEEPKCKKFVWQEMLGKDDMNDTRDPMDCVEWGTETVVDSWVNICAEDPEDPEDPGGGGGGGGGDTGVDICDLLGYDTPQECMCEWFGLGCTGEEGEGGGYEPPPPPTVDEMDRAFRALIREGKKKEAIQYLIENIAVLKSFDKSKYELRIDARKQSWNTEERSYHPITNRPFCQIDIPEHIFSDYLKPNSSDEIGKVAQIIFHEFVHVRQNLEESPHNIFRYLPELEFNAYYWQAKCSVTLPQISAARKQAFIDNNFGYRAIEQYLLTDHFDPKSAITKYKSQVIELLEMLSSSKAASLKAKILSLTGIKL